MLLTEHHVCLNHGQTFVRHSKPDRAVLVQVPWPFVVARCPSIGDALQVCYKHPRLAQCAGDKYLLFGSDQAAMKQQFLKFFSQEDWEANQRLQVRVRHPDHSCCLSGPGTAGKPLLQACAQLHKGRYRGLEPRLAGIATLLSWRQC